MKLLSHRKVTTRKSHSCWGCCKTFPKGTAMFRVTTKYGGLVMTYWCGPCQAFVDFIEKEDPSLLLDGFQRGEVRDWIAEHVREGAWPQP